MNVSAMPATSQGPTSEASEPWLVAASSAPLSYESSEHVGAAVNAALAALALPAQFISRSDRVVLKPNWVKEHDERRPGPDEWEHVVTHPAVIEAVARWVAGQLNGEGSIVICDAPQTDSSFAKIRQYCELDALVERCRAEFPGVRIDLLDLRPRGVARPRWSHGGDDSATWRPARIDRGQARR
jgi:uncharacterized protein (DUF362 family)